MSFEKDRKVSELIAHVERLARVSCDSCSNTVRFFGLAGNDYSAALIARTFFDAGWRVKAGLLLCPECIREEK